LYLNPRHIPQPMAWVKAHDNSGQGTEATCQRGTRETASPYMEVSNEHSQFQVDALPLVRANPRAFGPWRLAGTAEICWVERGLLVITASLQNRGD
jgi:hypothetical protein